MAIGRKTRMNTVDSFPAIGKKRFGEWVGALPFLTMVLILSYYTMIAGWYVVLADGEM